MLEITGLAEHTTELLHAASTGKLRRMATPPGLLPTLSEQALDPAMAATYALDIEELEALETRLIKALRGSGLCCQSRVATILSQHWRAWGELGQHGQFIFWLEATHGIRVRMTEDERLALIEKADTARWQAKITEEAYQPQVYEPEDSTTTQQRRRETAEQAQDAGIKVDWTDDGPVWDERKFPVVGKTPLEQAKDLLAQAKARLATAPIVIEGQQVLKSPTQSQEKTIRPDKLGA